eukprot:5457553-Amphidinium_carterae.2
MDAMIAGTKDGVITIIGGGCICRFPPPFSVRRCRSPAKASDCRLTHVLTLKEPVPSRYSLATDFNQYAKLNEIDAVVVGGTVVDVCFLCAGASSKGIRAA